MNGMQLCVWDEWGTLREPNLHDGRLLGINLPSPECVELTVAGVDESKYRITLDGVSQFRADDFRDGNIILDVTVARNDRLQMMELEPLVQALKDTQQFKDELKSIYDSIARESLKVLELNSSYGCHLIGIAKSVRVEPCEASPADRTLNRRE